METVCDPTTAEALDALDANLDTLQAVGVVPVDVVDARALTVQLERLDGRLQSVQIQLMAEIERSGSTPLTGMRRPR